MPAAEELDLIALICSRLCHDLAGSIGAVNNGVELLAEESDAAMREEAFGLIAQSAQDAARRLAFFRLALGASGDIGEPMAFTELSRVAQNYFAGGKIALAMPAADATLPKPLAKAVLLGLLLAAQALPRGGNLQLAPAGRNWRIAARGPMLRWPDTLSTALAETADWPREPLPALARYAQRLSRSAGCRFSTEIDETEIRLEFLS
ncbi:MAG TPA: histidine phosphotransferase family protein [Ferrovibrio sp.]|jgi:histidine phosphotransferase ChpT|uniref:histidine phosphotransferase family protein n=1 Tax=Ferrovibrio sp. TaxID=1917215 RepID=UPI002ED2321C